MEIEAKFAIANRSAYRDLLRLRSIAGYAIHPTGHVKMADRYFDTRDGRLLDSGYTCRIRTTSQGVLVTLKGLGGVEGAVHRRDEQEVRLPAATTDPTAWPDSPARTLALALTGGQPLQPLFDLEQDRARAEVRDGHRRVAELSLDEVRAAVGRRPAYYYELEAELLPDGTEADIEKIAAAYQVEHGLVPEPNSKFQRALLVLRTRGAAVQTRLDEEELGRVRRLLQSGNVELSRRAGAVLGWAEGLPTREIIARTGLSGGRIRFWLREWRSRRMGIFTDGGEARPDEGESQEVGEEIEPGGDDDPLLPWPEHEPTAHPSSGTGDPQPADDGTSAAHPPSTPGHDPLPGALRGPAPSPLTRQRKGGLPTVIEFAAECGVDLVRARFVASLAAELFDGLADAHRLPRKRRKLLRQAALLASAGAQQDPERSHRAGRDLILAQPLHGVETADRLLIACVVAFQREKVKPEREPAMEALAPKQRQHALLLAALLHMAEALDGSRTQSVTIEGIESCDATSCEVTVGGAAAETAVRQATARSGLWQHLTGRSIAFIARAPTDADAAASSVTPVRTVAGRSVSAPAPAAIEIPPVKPAEPMSEAGRKVLLTHFLKMLANEAGTRLGEDIEALHDMRVATRRMRAAYRIFAPYFAKDSLDQFNKDLRRTGGLLGAVRDLDVLLLAAEQVQAAAGEGESIGPLLQDWHARRDLARRDMLDHLNSSAYGRFVDRFRTFLTTPGAGALEIPAGEPRLYQVRHVVPRLILERYEVVRAYEPIIETAPLTTYHALRIEFKGLRYALEFFRDVLGDETSELIKQITAMQDVLGALQDAHVAEGLVAEFLDERTRRRKKVEAAPLSGVECYLATLRQHQQDLLQQFAGPWDEIISRSFRRALAAAIAAP